MMHRQSESRFRSAAAAAARWAFVIAALVVLTQSAWNLFVPDLFGLPRLELKQALGLVVFTALLGALVLPSGRRGRHG